ncbi:TatD family-associated radical SAM protein [Hydrogenispora ethanolica]|uniref:TatD family-associated radical SAM protein n=1 Tax=Hydrogenispora ethanolica TaxID=1082276 RepID=A0A4R1S512_HYDET|nr:TatD family nuclease-associated radical SAM protein [Hydrogenispora ethanolica]TCL74094.1 TatD family-associated radical SAM protein [Hydrogenispora ethanolica]
MNQQNQAKDSAPAIAYRLGDALYLNITNRCPNGCVFCIRESPGGVGYNLWLDAEPTADEVIEAAGDIAPYREVVFCGYGEPLLRPEIVTEVARRLKERASVPIRINTNGLADLFLGFDVLPQLQGLIDGISISLNAPDAEAYQRLTHSPYGLQAFPAVCEFARRSKRYIPKVTVSVVHYPGVDLERSAQVAAALGAEFRVREIQGFEQA